MIRISESTCLCIHEALFYVATRCRTRPDVYFLNDDNISFSELAVGDSTWKKAVDFWTFLMYNKHLVPIGYSDILNTIILLNLYFRDIDSLSY